MTDNKRTESEERVTSEVGSEGGAPGDVELERRRGPMKGSEATSTVDEQRTRTIEHRHDETGEGRRNP